MLGEKWRFCFAEGVLILWKLSEASLVFYSALDEFAMYLTTNGWIMVELGLKWGWQQFF